MILAGWASEPTRKLAYGCLCLESSLCTWLHLLQLPPMYMSQLPTGPLGEEYVLYTLVPHLVGKLQSGDGCMDKKPSVQDGNVQHIHWALELI